MILQTECAAVAVCVSTVWVCRLLALCCCVLFAGCFQVQACTPL
jgi:hypothetical protein